MDLRTSVSAAALLLMAGPAAAELDAATVWQEWTRDYFSDVEISAAQTVQNDTEVRLTDVTLRADAGRESLQVTLGGFSLTETADGGLLAEIHGNGTFEFWPDVPSPQNRMAADLTLDGLSVTIGGGETIDVALRAPLLAAVLTDLTFDGVRQQAEGAFGVADLEVRAVVDALGTDPMAVEVGLALGDLSVRGTARNVEDLAALDVDFTLASVDLEGLLDGPAALFEGREDFVGAVDSRARLTLGPLSLASSFEGAPYSDGDVNSFRADFAFDGVSLEQVAFLPENLTNFMPDGRDVIPDDLEFLLAMAAENVSGLFALRDGYAYDDTRNLTEAEVRVSPSNLDVRVQLAEDGQLTVRAGTDTGGGMIVREMYTSDGYSDDLAVNLSVADFVYGLNIEVPLDNIMMAAMQGLPPGLLYAAETSLGRFDLDMREESAVGEGPAEGVVARGFVEAASSRVRFTDTELQMSLAVGAFDGLFDEDMPAPVAANGRDLSLSIEAPLNTGVGTAPYAMAVRVGELVLEDSLWNLFDPARVLIRGPMRMDVNATGEMRATTSPMAFVMFGTSGGSPFSYETTVFDALVEALGASIEATGAFDTSGVMAGDVPVGSAEATATGLDALLEAAGRMGLLSAEELDEAAFFLGAFTVQQPGGERTIQVEINEQEHLIINGIRMQ